MWNNNSILNSIGTHTYGGSLYNSASPIAGTYGNIYNAYVQIVNDPAPKVIATKGSIEYMSADTLPNIEGFFDVLKDIGKIGTGIASTVLTAGSPFFGPVAGPLAAAAGAALGYVGTLCEDWLAKPKPRPLPLRFYRSTWYDPAIYPWGSRAAVFGLGS